MDTTGNNVKYYTNQRGELIPMPSGNLSKVTLAVKKVLNIKYINLR